MRCRTVFSDGWHLSKAPAKTQSLSLLLGSGGDLRPRQGKPAFPVSETGTHQPGSPPPLFYQVQKQKFLRVLLCGKNLQLVSLLQIQDGGLSPPWEVLSECPPGSLFSGSQARRPLFHSFPLTAG